MTALTDMYKDLSCKVAFVMDKTIDIHREAKKNPSKCPICLGLGRITIKEPYYDIETGKYCYSHTCTSCEGKGIVWG